MKNFCDGDDIWFFFFKYSSDIQITFVVIMLIWVASITMTLL